MGADEALLLQNNDFPPQKGKAPRDGKADDPAADDDTIRLIETLCHIQ
tara:strand:+ start:47 stop:190 length:144 start_codon:yes stop_codon:yes gene_type:complete